MKKSAAVYDAIVQLFLEDVGALYSVDGEGYMEGVISRKDLLRSALGNQNLNELSVNVIMTRMPNIVTITPEETLHEAAKKLIIAGCKGSGEGYDTYLLVGRITKTIITRAYLEIMADI